MDYSAIDQIMSAKSLATDPAFERLTVSIEPTPNLNGCPLGLYYPDGGKVVLPPDATQAALLHELGHRHGHFYYGDLSENYAEYFRKIYQPKGKALLYMGSNFGNLSRFGTLFEEGEKGAVEIALLQPLTPDQLLQIKTNLDSYQCECIECGHPIESEVHCSDIRCPVCGGQMRRAESPGPGQPRVLYGNSEVPWLRVDFTKGADWLVIIGAAMAASVLATVGALGYAVYKVSEELPWIVPISLLGTGMFFLLRAMTREAKAGVPAK